MDANSLIIQNALIINGKNEPAYPGSLTVENGRIAHISRGQMPPSDPGDFRVIDAGGVYLTPGFIDIHRHGDWHALKENSDDELLNRQGLTTVVNGNCGLSVMPVGRVHADEIRHFLNPVTGSKPAGPLAESADQDLGSYFAALKQLPRTVNRGMLIGNGSIRTGIAGFRPGPLTNDEIKLAHKELEKALSDGALGVSIGLGYASEYEYHVKDLIDVLEPIRGTSIPITTHIRSEGDGSYESIEEVIAVAKALNIHLHISHMKCIGRRNWHVGPERTLALIHREKDNGLKIDFDLYPYQIGSTQLLHVIPPAFQNGGTDQFMAGLRIRSFRDALTKALQTPASDFENIVELVGLDNVSASTLHSERFRRFAGRSITAIADAIHEDPYETLYDILAEEKCDVTMLDTVTCEEDMIAFYKDPLSSVISDAIYPDGGKLHPRVFASFPHFLIRFVRETGVFSLEEAIHKMTAAPARVLGIERGVIEEGAAADLCLFDLEDLTVPATFDDPCQFCTGFKAVIVGGVPVVENDVWHPEASGAGQIIRR